MNDFNSTFKLLPSFYERLRREKGDEFGECFIAAVPGSFYGRLFPNHSLHFVFSSYAVYWLSQIPKGLVTESGTFLNKKKVYLVKTSPPIAHKAYMNQFENDFSLFLKLRSEELKPGGRMVLALIGHDKVQRYPSLWEVFGLVLNDMVSEGLIEESKLESFNVPHYAPSAEEIRLVIEREGSFNIYQLEPFNHGWFVNSEENDNYAGAKQATKRFRSIGESLVANHFGNVDIFQLDDMYQRFTVKVFEFLEMGLGVMTNLLISLINKREIEK